MGWSGLSDNVSSMSSTWSLWISTASRNNPAGFQTIETAERRLRFAEKDLDDDLREREMKQHSSIESDVLGLTKTLFRNAACMAES